MRTRAKTLLIAENATCWLCLGHVCAEDASADHVIPRSMIDPAVPFANPTRLAHRDCNSKRGCDPPSHPMARRYYNRVLAEYERAKASVIVWSSGSFTATEVWAKAFAACGLG